MVSLRTTARTLCTVVLLASTSHAQQWFDVPRIFPETQLGTIRAAVDMDADGDVDLVWIGENVVQVFLNDGTGSYTKGPLVTQGAPYYHPYPYSSIEPRVGDVNGDGFADIVGAVDEPYPQAKLKILLGQPGGAFLGPQIIDLTDPPPSFNFYGWIRQIALGNIDADPALEIVEAHDMSSDGPPVTHHTDITWWDWNGSAWVASTPFGMSTGPVAMQRLEAFDPDGDGDSDLIAVGSPYIGGEWQLAVLRTAGGASALGPLFEIPTLAITVDSGDLDGDGDQDFATFELGQDGFGGPPAVVLRIFVNHGGSSFVPHVDAIAIADGQLGSGAWGKPGAGFVDLDGDSDLDAVYGYERVPCLVNDGAGDFALGSIVTMEHDSHFAFGRPFAVDVDGDAVLDLVGPRSVRHGDGTLPTDPAVYGSNVSGQFGEWEGDGDVDVLGNSGNVAINDATGHFQALPKQFPSPLPGTGKAFARINAAGDFNGDGDLDFTVMTFLNVAPFQFVYAGQTYMEDTGSGFCGSFGIVIPPNVYPDLDTYDGIFREGTDYDNDGDLDIAVKDGVLRNDAAGMAWTFVPGGFSSTDVVDQADFDQDGRVDLLSRTDAGGFSKRTLHRQTSALAFATQDVIVQPLDQVAHRARFLDLDDDGDLDIGVPCRNSTTSAFLVEAVAGSPNPAVAFGPADLGDSTSLDASDVDGDGLLDLAIGRVPVGTASSDSLYSLAIYRRSGPGFVAHESARHFLTGTVTGLLDLDDDGDDDAVGPWPIHNLRFAGADDGVIRQYGLGTAGKGGSIPVLGANGPVRVGSTTARLTIRRALGGAPALLFVGLAEAAIPGVVPGTALYVLPPVIVISFVLPGTPGGVGKGAVDLDTTGFLATVAGLSVYHQLIVIDPAGPGGVAASPGLAIDYGF